MSIIITFHILMTPPVFHVSLLHDICTFTPSLCSKDLVTKCTSQRLEKKQPLTFAIFLRKKNLCTTFYAFYILTLISTGCSQKKCHNTLYTVTSLHILANFVYFLWVGGSFYKLVIHMTYRS